MKNKNRCIMRRALCIALALLMLLTVVPLTVFAEETETRTFETGDIIAFGSYPQSEVTDATLKSALTSKAGSTDGWTSYGYYIGNEQYEPVQSDYMKYTDIEYNGSKYRGVYFTKYRPYYTGNSSSTDYSYQDNNGYSTSTIYWFKYEPMKWQVLSYDSTTGEAVVLSKSIIDSQQYYYTSSDRTIDGKTVHANNYEHSDIRTWLNDTFYNTAFGTSEKDIIVATTLDNSAWSTNYSEYDSNSTTDNVWLLSYGEVQNKDYGFTSDNYGTETRQVQGTEYALSQGLWNYSSTGCSIWRLRSAGYDYYRACNVDSVGWVDSSGDDVSLTFGGVRPALKLNLISEISPACKHTWQSEITEPTCADNGSKREFCANCGGAQFEYTSPALGHNFTEEIINSEHLSLSATKTSPAMYCYGCSRCGAIGTETFAYGEPLQDGEYNKIGDIIAFGSYPQSEVTDETLKNVLTAKAGSTDRWTSYNYYISSKQCDFMKYIDVEYDSKKYRGVYFNQYRPYFTCNPSSVDINTFQLFNGYRLSVVYWFEYEPLKWQVFLPDSTTGKAVVLSKSIIDSQQYYYTTSNRTIDGKTVYANNYERSDIRAWLNDTFYNTAFSKSEKNAIVATTLDNSASKTMYSSNSTTDRIWLLSEKEALNGVAFDSGTTLNIVIMKTGGTEYALCQGLHNYTYNGCAAWHLRTASLLSDSMVTVDEDGTVQLSNSVDITGYGVRPALTLNLATPTTKGECSHICHKSGIAKFFYKILRFFWKLFKINKVCDCGFEHY